MYVQERRIDVQQLVLRLQVDGLQDFYAKLRTFKGDNPEQQYEIGVNQFGHFKCSACGVHTGSFPTIATCYTEPCLSYQTR